MRHEKLLEPVDDAAPCGPDLDEEGDDDYLNYVFAAEDRLPARFLDGQFWGSGSSETPYDRTGLDLAKEAKTIDDLLERSRDLRLLSLDARFHIVSGQVAGFSEAVQAMAGLLVRYWNDVHPIGFDGDFTLRQNTVAALDDRVKVILPLQFATLLRDGRFGPISYRSYALATGQVAPRPDEPVPDAGAIEAALGNEANRAAVEVAHAQLTAAASALAEIRDVFMENAGFDYVPGFDGLEAAIRDILAMIAKAVPALGGAVPAPAAGGDGAVGASAEAGPGGAAVLMPTASMAQLPGVPVHSHAEAAGALQVAEDYFARLEPSAPSLILVRQARLLIGRPLVAALESLVAETAEQALIRFEDGIKFQIDLNRMRLLSDEPEAEAGPAAAGDFQAATRAEAAALILGAESYFRVAEPSSPVPVLLARARDYLNRDFLSILKDLMTRPE